jgi:predicted helicase
MSAEALDIPTLSIVMLCTPKPDVAQSVARVLRNKNPSVEPLVIDFLEKKSIWANFW